jgi:superfamily II RNA helicase
MPRITKKAKKLHFLTQEIIAEIHHIEKRSGINMLSKEYYFHLSPCIEAWMQNELFSNLLTYTDADEGSIIRYFRMAVQILREILDTPVSKTVKDRVHSAIQLINRDIVNAEKQLRE